MGENRQVDTWLVKIDSDGELEWETTYGDPANDDYAQSMIHLDDGTYLIGGIGNGMHLTRIDENGTILWKQSLLDSSVYGGESLIELEDGGFLVAGFKQLVKKNF